MTTTGPDDKTADPKAVAAEATLNRMLALRKRYATLESKVSTLEESLLSSGFYHHAAKQASAAKAAKAGNEHKASYTQASFPIPKVDKKDDPLMQSNHDKNKYKAQAKEGDEMPSAGEQIVIRLLRGELTENFDAYGRMDPFALVHWYHEDGTLADELGQTRVDWSGHMHPEWMHTCKRHAYRGRGSKDKIVIEVREKDMGGMIDDICGKAEILVDELLAVNDNCATDGTHGLTSVDLVNSEGKQGKRNVGTVTMQAFVVDPNAEAFEHGHHTEVDASMFESPVKRIGVSGGTAPFFALQLKSPIQIPGADSESYYIGKDLSRAEDEVDFYEGALLLKKKDARGWRTLLPFMFDYQGAVALPEDGAQQAKPKELLVLRNLRDQCKKLRMLDLKMGQKTAEGGWKGKGQLDAIKNNVVDRMTNSAGEGFRLEGFDGAPPAIDDLDPLLDLRLGSQVEGNEKSKLAKMARRVALQRMPCQQILMHFIDLHKVGNEGLDWPTSVENQLTPTELAEITLNEIVIQLIKLAQAARQVPVAQKWIGSSVALGFDCGALPESEEEARKKVRVNIFDWGRSELNTLEKDGDLTDKTREDRAKYWTYYLKGLDLLAWEAARSYVHRFGTRPLSAEELSLATQAESAKSGKVHQEPWIVVKAVLYDYDAQSDNDMIGSFDLTIKEPYNKDRTAKVKMAHCLQQAAQATGALEELTLTYSVDYKDMSEVTTRQSRLAGVYRITLKSTTKVVALDAFGANASDCFLEVTATSHLPLSRKGKKKGKNFMFKQQTSVKVDMQTPIWNETIDLPVMSDKLDELGKPVIVPFVQQLEDLGIQMDKFQDELVAVGENDDEKDEKTGKPRPKDTDELLSRLFPSACLADDEKDKKMLNIFKTLVDGITPLNHMPTGLVSSDLKSKLTGQQSSTRASSCLPCFAGGAAICGICSS